MPGKRIPDLTAIAGASTANDDNLVIYDTNEGTTKRILRSQLAAGLVGDLPYTPSGGISATTVPTAIAELDSEAAKSAALAASSGSSLVGFLQAGIDAEPTTVQAKLRETVSVLDFGADPTGGTDSTDAIQAAFDSEGFAPIFFPPGLYKVTGSGDACLTLTKNRNLIGCGRASTIYSDSASASTSLIKITFSDNAGFGDVRQWLMDGIYAYFDSGAGKHCLQIEGGFQVITSTIRNCNFLRGGGSGAYGIYVYDNLAHSIIEECTFDTAYMKCFDANVIRKCLTFGSPAAITFDCTVGVRNNTVRENTIVNRDGAVHIINGDNIRILNNQIELAQIYTPSSNQSAASAMVWVQGVDRTVFNTVIEDNNFGGGTNLDHLIYLDNAQRTVIDKNNLIAVNVAEVYLTANAQYNIVGRKNRIASQVSNPRTGTLFKANIIDLGVGNMGVFKSGGDYEANDWDGADFWKDEGGMVNFIGIFSSGTTTGGTVMANMPTGYTPYIQPDLVKRNLLTYSEQLNNTVWYREAISAPTADVATAPDGTQTADLVIVTSSTAAHFIRSSAFALANSTQYAFSAYFKQESGGSSDQVRWEITDLGATKWVRGILNLTSGTTTIGSNGTYYSAASASVSNAGNGWYRLEVTVTTQASGSAGNYNMYFTPKNVASVFTSYSGNTTVDRVLAWGFQAEQSATVTLYQRVASASEFETVFASRKLLATTDSGVGYVDITRQGVLSVGSLPSNVSVGIESFQASAIQN
jgi:hypothetical protein